MDRLYRRIITYVLECVEYYMTTKAQRAKRRTLPGTMWKHRNATSAPLHVIEQLRYGHRLWVRYVFDYGYGPSVGAMPVSVLLDAYEEVT